MRTKQDIKTVRRFDMTLTMQELLKMLQVTVPNKATKFSFLMTAGQGMNSTSIGEMDKDISIHIVWEEPV